VFKLAKSRGQYNTLVTNGYMTPEAFELFIDAGLDAMNVDIKGSTESIRKYCKGIDGDKIWANCRLARSRNIHLEVTTLVIPTINDNDEILKEICVEDGMCSFRAWYVYQGVHLFAEGAARPRKEPEVEIICVP